MENKEIVQLDIVTAFLESKADEELYLRLPKEFGLANNGNVILNSNRIELRVSVTVRLNRSLTYAAITTRPDIAYATGLVGRFAADPSMLHWAAIKRILRYLKNSLGLRIRLGRSDDRGFGGRERENKDKKAPITVYTDADFTGEVDGMRSTTGFVILDR